MRFDALATLATKVTAFWRVTPWGMLQAQNVNILEEYAAFFLPQDEIPRKCRYLSTNLHGVITQPLTEMSTRN
jgi:hypothetical protein